jgi:hypothetical protein
VLVEVARKAYIASIVPVIVNAILNEHQIVVDIVAFVNKGDFPRSRLGEKQRGKILAGWVSRKMRTMAQFAIKDNDREALGPPGTSSGEQSSGQGAAALDEQHRASLGSFRSSSGGGPLPPNSSSLRNVEPVPQIIPEQRELEHHQQYPYHQQQGGYDALALNMNNMNMDDGARTPGPVEMPADDREINAYDNEQTPTKNYMAQQQQQQQQPQHVSGLGEPTLPHGFELPDFDRFGRDDGDAPPPAVGPKPGTAGGSGSGPSSRPGTGPGSGSGQFGGGGGGIGGAMSSQTPPQIRLPGVDGRESLDDWDLRPGSGNGSGGGGKEEEDDWTRDAYMSMNLAGTLGGR